MIYLKVQYDAYNRTFTLVDRNLGKLLEDYGLYDLAIPIAIEEAEEQGCFSSVETVMAHA
jgi:hypothetical protein